MGHDNIFVMFLSRSGTYGDAPHDRRTVSKNNTVLAAVKFHTVKRQWDFMLDQSDRELYN